MIKMFNEAQAHSTITGAYQTRDVPNEEVERVRSMFRSNGYEFLLCETDDMRREREERVREGERDLANAARLVQKNEELVRRQFATKNPRSNSQSSEWLAERIIVKLALEKAKQVYWTLVRKIQALRKSNAKKETK